jgi:hypothetical protein
LTENLILKNNYFKNNTVINNFNKYNSTKKIYDNYSKITLDNIKCNYNSNSYDNKENVDINILIKNCFSVMNAALDCIIINRNIFACDAVMEVCSFYMNEIDSFIDILLTSKNVNFNLLCYESKYLYKTKNIEFIELFENSLISIN